MALVVADRVQETTTTTGTGTYTLAGAKDGFQSFAAVGNSNTTYYACTDGTDYEVGIGTYTASGTTLARTTIIESSNSDAAVNWGAGEKDIFVTLPASKAVVLDASGNATFSGTISATGQISGGSLDIDNIGINGGTITAQAGSMTLSGNVDVSNGLDVTGNITVSGTVDGRDVATDGTKLDGIEASADVTDTANVTAAGALMDSEVTNLAQVKAFDSSDYATAAQGTTADGALQRSGGTVTGGVTFQSTLSFLDNKQIRLGSSNDLRLQHNGVSSYIDNYTSHLYLRNLADDSDVYIQSDDGSGGTADYFVADGSTGEVLLYHYGSEKLATKSTGINVTGTVIDDGATHDGDVTFTGANYNVVWDKSDNALEFADSAQIRFGAGSDLKIFHNASDSYLTNATGALYVQNGATDNDVIIRADNGSGSYANYFLADGSSGSAIMYHYGSAKIKTISSGVQVTGDITVSGTVDGRDIATDGPKLDGIEASADVTDATNVAAAGAAMTSGATFTGDVTFDGATAGRDIVFDRSDNALEFADNAILKFGQSADLQIFHDASNSYVQANVSGNLYLRNATDNFDVIVEADNGSGGLSTYIQADGSTGEAKLFFYGSEKLSTKTGGVDVTGTVTATAFSGDGSSLTGISAGAEDDIFWENGQTVSSNYTITNNKNAMSAGPITIASGVTVTVGDGEAWTVV